MKEVLLNYFVQAVLGGASGYITNDYAINMLFKEYTPLKIGGVIKKTRNEFIENLSSMVENDMINKEKLHEVLSSDEFKEKFEKLTNDFFHQYLYSIVDSDTFSNIQEFDSTLKNSEKFIENIIEKHWDGFLNLLWDNIGVKDFIKPHRDKIIDALFSSLMDFLNNTEAFENLLVSIFENNELKFSDFFGENFSGDKIIRKITEILIINPSFYEVFNSTYLTDGINESLNLFYNRQVKDIVNFSDKELKEHVISFVNSHRGQGIIHKSCENLLSYCKSLDISLFSLMKPSFEENLKKYIQENSPYITQIITRLMVNNSSAIEKVLEDSINEVINEADGLRAKFLNFIKNSYIKRHSLVDLVIAYLEKPLMKEKLTLIISSIIIEQLKKNTIMELAVKAEMSGLTADGATPFITSYINNHVGEVIDYISNLYVKDIIPKLDISREMFSLYLGEIFQNKFSNFVYNTLKDVNFSAYSETFAKETGKFIKTQINDKEEYVKNLLGRKIDSINFSEYQLNNEVNQFTKEKVKGYYKRKLSKLKDIELSLALNKINSIENLVENSSRSLRTYMINNTGAILKGSIKGIVSDNLNKLSDDEIVDFANDFIGRELKPIMFFGGILGVIAGLILAVFQKSLNPGEINIVNMATYSFVGFITNVIAINMLFKPYKENKILSKIPFLRNFSQGYIVKNQKTFGEKTAHYINNTLLSKNSITELFENNEEKIKKSFITNVEENNYEAVKDIFSKNKESIVKETYSFIKNKITTNLNILSNYLYEKTTIIKLKYFMNKKTAECFSTLICERLEDIDKNGLKVYSLISSEKQIGSAIYVDYFKNILIEKALKYFEILIDSIEKNNIKNQLFKYDYRYRQVTEKTIGSVIDLNDEALNNSAKKISEVLFHKSFGDILFQKTIDLLDKSIEGKTIEELLAGKIKEYIDRNLPFILSQKLINIITQNKDNFSSILRSQLKSNLSFIEKSMYSLVRGDEILKDLLDKIIEKMPELINSKQEEINLIVTEFAEERLYKTKVDIFYKDLNLVEIKEIMVDFFKVEDPQEIEGLIYNLTHKFYKKLENKSIKEILKYLNMDNLESILSSYEKEIDAFTDKIKLMDQDHVIEKMSAYVDTVVNEFSQKSFNEIFESVTLEDVEEILYNTARILKNQRDTIKELLKAYANYNKDIKLSIFIDKNEFIKSTEIILKEFLNNDSTEEKIKTILSSVIQEAIDSNFYFIHAKSKEYFLNIFVDAGMESLKNNLEDILKSIEFHKIAKEEIEKMNPEKIHEMFNSFGEKYFRRLMVYGFGGFVFGINMYVGFTLTGLKILSEMFKK